MRICASYGSGGSEHSRILQRHPNVGVHDAFMLVELRSTVHSADRHLKTATSAHSASTCNKLNRNFGCRAAESDSRFSGAQQCCREIICGRTEQILLGFSRAQDRLCEGET